MIHRRGGNPHIYVEVIHHIGGIPHIYVEVGDTP